MSGSDDRKLTKACLRRANGIELQVLRLEPLVPPLRAGLLTAEAAFKAFKALKPCISP